MLLILTIFDYECVNFILFNFMFFWGSFKLSLGGVAI